ncbi:small rab-related gtpase [Anaeramoeba ignava]|uniref:Small rab-related gtpase n=1 Tax=Anaeramoeba ignava TaxID=1746090 RepID=A0A9Q0LE85_ANAIG|nr:small rab-related gtpase [Anaeramoeba ignava]
MSFDHLFKVIIFGGGGVGKTSLINRYVDNTFFANVPQTVGVDFKAKDISVTNEIIRLQLWDTAGQDDFRLPFTSSIYKGAQGIVIVFDLTSEDTIRDVQSFLKEIDDHCIEDVVIVLAGNKSDLSNQVEYKSIIDEITKKKEYPIFLTSALKGTNVEEMFEHLAKELLEKQAQSNITRQMDAIMNPTPPPENIVKPEIPTNKNPKKGCC